MDPEKKWNRYTQIGDVFINMQKYRERLVPTENGCLEYRGPCHRQGYRMIGVLNADGTRKMTVVHRVAMRMKLDRALTTNDDVKHSCRNNACVNPSHLYLRNEENCNEPTTTIPQVPATA